MKSLSILICAAACSLAQTPPAPAPAGAPQLEDGLYAIFHTDKGDITARLFEKETPLTVANFVGLAKGTKAWLDPKTKAYVHRSLYANIGFHRIMMDQMIQSGSAVPDGSHNCGVKLKDEIRPDLRFDQVGRLAMANTGGPNTGACQFFITDTKAAPWDGAYTIFGQVVDGQSVVHEISRVPVVDRRDFLAKTPVKLISVTIKRVGPEPAAPAPAPAKKSTPATTTPVTKK
ncbi:MAG TPA: peptidylprolyl isomerase [Verrucomicrobiae bacterium]|nr:peptidylprolyl isomerase [Verrucomicrobiae bacterium]